MKTFIAILVCAFTNPLVGQSPIEEFVETFNGNGPFDTVDSAFSGLDNEGWWISGIGQFRDGGFNLVANPRADRGEGVFISKRVIGRTSFVERIEVKDVLMGPLEGVVPPLSVSSIDLIHYLDFDTPSWFAINCFENDRDVDEWKLGISLSGSNSFRAVPSGPHVAMEIHYDDTRSEARFSFDSNIDDEVPAMWFGPYRHNGPFQETHESTLTIYAQGFGYIESTLDSWSLLWDDPEGLGDFNQNGVLDAGDMDMLSRAVRDEMHVGFFDLNSDGSVNDGDRELWVVRLRNTYFGDANLDGEFNTRDLVQVFEAGEYEQSVVGQSTWAHGDWNGDGGFNSRDLVLVFQAGGYEIGPRPAVQDVPEPSLGLGVLFAFAIARLSIRDSGRRR
jgi:hypothetical protein